MRIAIIAHGLSVAGGLAVGKKIASGLKRVGNQHEYFFTLPSLPPERDYHRNDMPEHAELIRIGSGFKERFIYETFTLNSQLKKWQPDVIWCLGNIGFSRPLCPQAVLIQNAHFVYPEVKKTQRSLLKRLTATYRNRKVQQGIAASDLLICQTGIMLKRTQEHFNYHGKTAILGNPVTLLDESAAEDTPIQAPHSKSKFTLLCLSRYYVHKNLEALLDTYEQHAEQLANTKTLLTIDAKQHPDAEKLLARLQQPVFNDAVVNIGPVSADKLPAIYKEADAMILPSLLESFSGTYIEAMQFDCPIATSDRDFAHEVCGEAADYFDPLDPASIADSIARLSTDQAYYQTLQDLGKTQLNQWIIDPDEQLNHVLNELTAIRR